MPLSITCGRVAASALALAMISAACGPVSAASTPAVRPTMIALSALGDLTPYRSIAADTLAIVDKGDLMAARVRIKDLETAWDKAEASLKPKDKTTWTVLDKMIDTALTDLRTPLPKAADCAASLKALITRMDAVQAARLSRPLDGTA